MNEPSQPDSPAVAGAAPSGGGERATASQAAWRGSVPALLVALLALGVATWQWYDGRGEIRALRQELAK